MQGCAVSSAEHGCEEVHQEDAQAELHEDHERHHEGLERLLDLALLDLRLQIHVAGDRKPVREEDSIGQHGHVQAVQQVRRARKVHGHHREEGPHVPNGAEEGQDSDAHAPELPQRDQEPHPREEGAQAQHAAIPCVVERRLLQRPEDDAAGQQHPDGLEEVPLRAQVLRREALRLVAHGRKELVEGCQRPDHQRRPGHNIHDDLLRSRPGPVSLAQAPGQEEVVADLNKVHGHPELGAPPRLRPVEIHNGAAPRLLEDLGVPAVGDGQDDLQVAGQVCDIAGVEGHRHEDVRRRARGRRREAEHEVLEGRRQALLLEVEVPQQRVAGPQRDDGLSPIQEGLAPRDPPHPAGWVQLPMLQRPPLEDGPPNPQGRLPAALQEADELVPLKALRELGHLGQALCNRCGQRGVVAGEDHVYEPLSLFRDQFNADRAGVRCGFVDLEDVGAPGDQETYDVRVAVHRCVVQRPEADAVADIEARLGVQQRPDGARAAGLCGDVHGRVGEATVVLAVRLLLRVQAPRQQELQGFGLAEVCRLPQQVGAVGAGSIRIGPEEQELPQQG
mmetsp:Transcript_60962/g.169012  ORF Transcript_60962/g.169012 Transcript_60962/m.169012 type:complete len:561 (-) Transcript_60962:20-1702(-)